MPVPQAIDVSPQPEQAAINLTPRKRGEKKEIKKVRLLTRVDPFSASYILWRILCDIYYMCLTIIVHEYI